jgi:hypothetical protein
MEDKQDAITNLLLEIHEEFGLSAAKDTLKLALLNYAAEIPEHKEPSYDYRDTIEEYVEEISSIYATH